MSYPIGPETPNDFRGIGDITGLQDVNPPGGGGLIRNAAELVRNNFFLNILGGFLNLGQALGSFLGELVDAFFGRYTGSNPDLIAFQDGQLEINNRTDLLSPLLDYGSCYMNTKSEFDQSGWLRFRNQIGPMQGCELASGSGGNSIILGDQGLWDIRCQIWADYINILGGNVAWEIRVHRPNGTIYSRTRGQFNSQSPTSSIVLCSVVVPDAGYGVGVWVSEIAAFRGLLGGPDRNRLTVQHISRDTTTGDTGQ